MCSPRNVKNNTSYSKT